MYTYKQSGAGIWIFKTSDLIEYTIFLTDCEDLFIGYTDLQITFPIYEFGFSNNLSKNDFKVNDPGIGDTIVCFLSHFFSLNPDHTILIQASDEDNQAEVRIRKFLIWKEKSKFHADFYNLKINGIYFIMIVPDGCPYKMQALDLYFKIGELS